MSLYQRYLDYLNQAMPDISGIFRSTPAQTVEEDTVEETVAQPVGITPQLLQLTEIILVFTILIQLEQELIT